MVQLRFGSLVHFGDVCQTYAWIAKTLHLHPNTVMQIIKRFLKNEHMVIDRRTMKKKETFERDLI